MNEEEEYPPDWADQWCDSIWKENLSLEAFAGWNCYMEQVLKVFSLDPLTIDIRNPDNSLVQEYISMCLSYPEVVRETIDRAIVEYGPLQYTSEIHLLEAVRAHYDEFNRHHCFSVALVRKTRHGEWKVFAYGDQVINGIEREREQAS